MLAKLEGIVVGVRILGWIGVRIVNSYIGTGEVPDIEILEWYWAWRY